MAVGLLFFFERHLPLLGMGRHIQTWPRRETYVVEAEAVMAYVAEAGAVGTNVAEVGAFGTYTCGISLVTCISPQVDGQIMYFVI